MATDNLKAGYQLSKDESTAIGNMCDMVSDSHRDKLYENIHRLMRIAYFNGRCDAGKDIKKLSQGLPLTK